VKGTTSLRCTTLGTMQQQVFIIEAPRGSMVWILIEQEAVVLGSRSGMVGIAQVSYDYFALGAPKTGDLMQPVFGADQEMG